MKKRIRSERGAALLEAALIMPMILLISVGIFEFGRAYQASQVLTNAAREGARLAVLEGRTDGDVRVRVNQYVTDGGLTALSDANIQINRTVALTATATASTVTITYPYTFMVLNPVMRLVTPSLGQRKKPPTCTYAVKLTLAMVAPPPPPDVLAVVPPSSPPPDPHAAAVKAMAMEAAPRANMRVIRMGISSRLCRGASQPPQLDAADPIRVPELRRFRPAAGPVSTSSAALRGVPIPRTAAP